MNAKRSAKTGAPNLNRVLLRVADSLPDAFPIAHGRTVGTVAGMLDPLTSTTFGPAVGQSFTVELEAGAPDVELMLDRLVELPSTPDAQRTQPFTLTFLGPAGQHLPQGTYRLHCDGLGELDVFLVPLGPLADGRHQYEAVFN